MKNSYIFIKKKLDVYLGLLAFEKDDKPQKSLHSPIPSKEPIKVYNFLKEQKHTVFYME